MKKGVRALGIAESYRGQTGESYFAGAVVRASRVADDFVFGTTTVGGTDATETVIRLYERLDREDVRFLMLSGVALSWYNLVDLSAVHEATGVPVVSVTYERSDGLRDAIEDEFEGEERDKRLALYDRLPDRRKAGGMYVRSVGVEDDRAAELVRGFTYDGRPEPVRVARLAARGILGYEEGQE